MEEADNSEETSLQVSSTSPEVIPTMGRALQALVLLVGHRVHRRPAVHCNLLHNRLLSCQCGIRPREARMVIYHLVVRACAAATIDHQDRDRIAEKGP